MVTARALVYVIYMRSNAQNAASSGLYFRIFAFLILGVAPLKAYADPGSGLLIWQVMGAFFVGCLYQVRKFFVKIRKGK